MTCLLAKGNMNVDTCHKYKGKSCDAVLNSITNYPFLNSKNRL
jgi:hypothetical protein